MKKYVKALILVLSFSVMLTATMFISNGASYNYDFWKNALPSAEGLTYKDTYYGKDILDINDDSKTLTFNTLEDMVIYNNEIFILDSENDTSSEVQIEINKTILKTKGVSSIVILNEEMKCIEQPVTEFEITKHVYDTLRAYYNFNKELSAITSSDFEGSDLSKKAPYMPIIKESVLEGTDEYSGASVFLNNAQGLAVVEEGDSYSIYIADTDNSRILKMTSDYVVTEVYLTPTDEVFYQWDTETDLSTSTKRLFKPTKIAVDKTKRVYCVAKNTYEGIIEFSKATYENTLELDEETKEVKFEYSSANGKFNRFLGKNVVTANPLKQFWYKIMSEIQKEQQALTLPPEFINITMDEDGFLYATSYPDSENVAGSNMIKAINTSGKDVLRRNGYVAPNGDAVFLSAHTNKEVTIGASTLTAIAVNPDGFYSVTDAKRGRIFTYDTEGNLLYISGEKGELSNSINEPVAISYLTIEAKENTEKQELVLIVDRTSKSIISYSTSTFGSLVNQATKLYLENDIIGAEKYWREVVKMNSNYELGYVGIGKSLLRLEQFEEAMYYFELGHNAAYYSKAYQQYRDNILKENFALIMTGLVITAVGLCGLMFVKHQNKKKQGLVREDD
ncbi:MAG: hypothetical protein IJX78_03690 [Bacilli bacterium]|nr:hypothetical protein [Bacilli bacterium]